MKVLRNIILLCSVVLAVCGCNKEDIATLTLERTSLYFSSWKSPSQTIHYTSNNTADVVVRSVSEGWAAIANHAERTITVTAAGSSSEDKEAVTEGALTVDAVTAKGEITTYYIYLYMLGNEMVVLDEAGRANCYVINEGHRCYSFDALHRPDGESIATERVELLWESESYVVQNVDFVDGKVEFYIESEEEGNTRVVDSNAVLAAYNSADKMVWSWHLWIVNDNPLTASANPQSGVTFMDRSLGAHKGNNSASQEQKAIHSAYGLYYQWGRKDPFARPYAYDASGADEEVIYGSSGGYIYATTKAVSSSVGTVEYVTANPMVYITNAACVEEGGDGIGDWMYSANDKLWNDEVKSLYDPCPYGWRVPRASELATLSFASDNTPDLDTARKQYGWYLENASERYFFSGNGYRRYTDGKIQNVNYSDAYPYTPEPWEGYYWSSTANNDGSAVSLYFDLITTRSLSHYAANKNSRRANGMQVRCIKE
ncbi:MAG: hypothetical protein IKV09_03370 [Alistipes sp.]|nr:hypothetical protein [Alistipes sp.]